MTETNEYQIFEKAVSQMESAAVNFAYRCIKDGQVRKSYISQTQLLAQEYRKKVLSSKITAKDAANQVHQIRNEILEAQRLRSSDIGRAKAISLKKTGLTMDDLAAKYSKKKFGKAFLSLTENQKNLVYLEIIESSGRPRPSVNAAAVRYSALGRGLLIVTIGISIYNIASADDKVTATAREGVVIGGGFAGGAAGGAVAGLACGPGAPLCVAVGVFLGGALGAMGADVSFGWFF